MQPQSRYNMYEVIHKALRASLSRTLVAIGQLDVDDEPSVRELEAEVATTLAMMRGHLASENAFVHTAMEARAPGSTRRIAEEHAHHEDDIDVLAAACATLAAATPGERESLAQRLYVMFDLFVQDNLTHMRHEEDHHNAVLWAMYSDAEILAIEQALVAALPPEKKALYLHAMLPAVPTRDRAKLLGGLRQVLPPEAFAGLYASVLPLLDAPAQRRVAAALGEPVALADAA